MAEQENGTVVAPSSPFAVAQVSLPKGGGAIRGIGEKFAANPVTGTASFSVPIATTPGRASFGPTLALHYDSGAGNGPFGFGWQLVLPAITRKTDKGMPRYAGDREIERWQHLGSGELFWRSISQYNVTTWYGRTAESRIADPIVYEYKAEVGSGVDLAAPHERQPRTEDAYARIEPRTHWRTISSGNVTTLYGFDEDSVVESGHHPTQAFTYLMCRRFDSRGNLIVCTHARESDDNVDVNATYENNRGRDSVTSSGARTFD
jgi:hypothetical protein